MTSPSTCFHVDFYLGLHRAGADGTGRPGRARVGTADFRQMKVLFVAWQYGSPLIYILAHEAASQDRGDRGATRYLEIQRGGNEVPKVSEVLASEARRVFRRPVVPRLVCNIRYGTGAPRHCLPRSTLNPTTCRTSPAASRLGRHDPDSLPGVVIVFKLLRVAAGPARSGSRRD
jgi:hypothetical protein